MMVARGWGGDIYGELLVNEYREFVIQDKKVLEICYTTM